MQQLKNLNRIWGWVLTVVLTATIMVACNNEGEKAPETTADTPAVSAPAVTDTIKPDSLPTVDTSATTRPDGNTTGGAR